MEGDLKVFKGVFVLNVNIWYISQQSEGFINKKTANYPHFVDKGREGSQLCISVGEGGGGGGALGVKKKFL